MRVCFAYDCLYPCTVGGAERWYRALAERLAAAGHEVAYLTLRQWPRGDAPPEIPGVKVIAVGPRTSLYAREGRRLIVPTLIFAAGVFRHLVRNGGRYDIVHTFGGHPALLAAAAARRGNYRLVVDWFEVWTREYWRKYLGRLGGWIGWRLQRTAVRSTDAAISFSRLHAERLRGLGVQGEIAVVEGLVPELDATEPKLAEAVFYFAGRHIPEKHVPALVPALRRARERLPDLRGEIYGDGPERGRVLELIVELELDDACEAPGFVAWERLEGALSRALCLVLPSRREGYGLVVVEAAAKGVPSIVVRAPDNAAVELVEEGQNGFIAPSADPDDLADAIVRVHDAGPALRASTAAWYRRNARRLSLEGSLETVLQSYRASS